MTAKRFECDKGSRIIIDNETKLHYIMTLDWECNLVTKLLNQFSDENEQLKSDCDYRWKKYCNTRKEMLHEIEQLKFQLKECSEHKLFSRRELERENDELKQFKNRVINVIDEHIKEVKEIFEDGRIDLTSYNSAMITLTGLKEELFE